MYLKEKMRFCSICKRRFDSGTGNLFQVPKDPNKRAKWSKICCQNFAPSNLICVDHFLPTSIVRTGNKILLLPNAEPFVTRQKVAKNYYNTNNEFSINNSHTDQRSLTPAQVFTKPLHMTAVSPSFNWTQLATTGNSIKQQSKEQETQTDNELSKLEYFEKVRVLESEKKDLQLKLSQAHTAVNAMRQIFTEGQIRKLMSPNGILWGKEDIANAVSLHAVGPKAYDYLYKKGFPLPHVSTLQRWGKGTKIKANQKDSSSSISSTYGKIDSILEEKTSVSPNEMKEVQPKEMDHLKDQQNCSGATETLPITVKEEIVYNDDVSAEINCSGHTETLFTIVKKEEEFDESDEANVDNVGINKDNVLKDISIYVAEKLEFEEYECDASSASWIGEIPKRSLETASDASMERNNPEELEYQRSSFSWLKKEENKREELDCQESSFSKNLLKQTNDTESEVKLCST